MSISGDGRYVAFASFASNLADKDTNACRDIFVYDLLCGTNLLASVGLNGTCANGSSGNPMISQDGRYVAFSSWATNLVTSDVNQAQDVFVRDLQDGTTTLVNVDTGVTGSGINFTPIAISTNGRSILFSRTSSSGNKYFLRDLASAHTYTISTVQSCNTASMTPDGRFVALR
jgi:Tol biopolymer transport system component